MTPSDPRPATPVKFVGAGPGDPGLLTVRGERALAEAQVVVADATVSPSLLDGVDGAAERVRVGEDARGVPRVAVPGLLAARAKAGLRVVRLVAGDAADFGTEAALLVAAGLAVEVVPGVTPAVAGAAYAGIPLTASESGLAVGVAGGGGLPLGPAAEAGAWPVTEASLAGAVDGLVRSGRPVETPAALISGATTFEQRTVTAALGRLEAEARRAGVGFPAILVVGDVVRRRSSLAWLERRPLFGRRVLVTRPRAQAGRLVALLEAYGADVVSIPTIRLEPPDDWRPLDEALGRLTAFRWLVFTSANGVAAFRERLAVAGRDARALAGLRIAAIGPETAESLRRGGLEPDLVPPEFRAEGLLEALMPLVEPGSELLLVRAAEARELLPRELRARGVRVTVVPAYRTVAAKEGGDRVVELLEGRRIDAVTFTSSSTVRGFLALLAPDEVRRRLAGVVLAAIGPITAATVAEYGLEAEVIPREYTVPALAAAIAARFARTDPA